VLLDDNGTPYLYFGGQYPTNARVIQLGANLTSVVGSAMPLFATNFFEDSWIHKRNGIYYYTYCNQFSVGAAIYCETNSNPTNGFVPEGTVMANPPSNVNNNNHHAIFSYQGNWYITYHNRYVALQNGLSTAAAVYKRSICLDRVNYNANGTLQQVVFTTDGLPQLKNLNPYNRVEAETIARQGEEKGRRDADHRRHRVQKQPAERLCARAVIFQDDVHGVDPVREIVRQDGDRDDDADDSRGLKGQTDGDAVHNAMNAQHGGGEAAAMRGIAVKRQDSVEHQVE